MMPSALIAMPLLAKLSDTLLSLFDGYSGEADWAEGALLLAPLGFLKSGVMPRRKGSQDGKLTLNKKVGSLCSRTNSCCDR